MRIKTIFRSLIFVLFAAAALAGGLQPVAAQDGPASLTGWLSIQRGDGPQGSNATQTVYYLQADDGTSTRLLPTEDLLAAQAGLLALDRQRVTVYGRGDNPSASGDGFTVETIEADGEGTPAVDSAAISGARPFLSIMCKFADYTQEPQNLAYFQGMYGATYPGLNHYWRELSYNNINITGSNALGWYTLPQPRSYYIYGGQLDFDRAANDCTALANPHVNFAGFTGINLMFNYDLDGYAWGGSHYMTLDGVTKAWPMTWEPPWGYESIGVISHEMGHAFGLPHSSGEYGETYDNRWDVMSDLWSDCGRSTHATYGCLGQHTIAYHKDLLGWVPASMKYTLNYSAIPAEADSAMSAGAYLMAKLPITGTNQYYTVETRFRPGYDVKLPNPGVIIHHVNPSRYESPAHVIDIDNDGDTGDGGAIWSVGETFTDSANHISVQVQALTSNGYTIRIQNGSAAATIEIDSNAQVLTFGDVPLGYWASQWIDKLYNNKVTGGCSTNPLMFCPTKSINRAELAVFVLRAKYGSTYNPPAVSSSTGFTDVPTNHWAAAWIKQLAAEGITGGCGNGNYCPNNPVDRASMAVILLRASHAPGYQPPAVGASTGFTDVPTNHWAAAWIKQLVAEGIASGCTASTYCPTAWVTREQMSVFLVETFNLP
ncbi:MAG: S-layer homology domain-containing protein [Chloroflexota bacterium]